MGLVIRQIGEDEYPSFTNTVDEIAKNCFSSGIVLLAETETGYPMGFLAAKKNIAVINVVYVYVKPLFRRRGIGTALFGEIVARQDNVAASIRHGSSLEEAQHAFLKKFHFHYDFSYATYLSFAQECKELHREMWEKSYKKIFSRLLTRGCVLKRFEECEEDIVSRIGDMVGDEFAYNTNPGLYHSYSTKYSYCLFKNDVPIAFSLIETTLFGMLYSSSFLLLG